MGDALHLIREDDVTQVLFFQVIRLFPDLHPLQSCRNLFLLLLNAPRRQVDQFRDEDRAGIWDATPLTHLPLQKSFLSETLAAAPLHLIQLLLLQLDPAAKALQVPLPLGTGTAELFRFTSLRVKKHPINFAEKFHRDSVNVEGGKT